MDTLKLSELIGQEILELRYHYVPENEYGMQAFHSYIKLSNDKIIDIPHFDREDYLELTQDNLNFFKTMFDTGEPVNEKAKKFFVEQKIVDFYFSYYNNEIDFDHSAFIKLSNGYYLTENNFGPMGLTNIDLIILDEKQFAEEVERLKSVEVEVRSFTKTKI
ncbi:hypothetical protein [Ferruginibacter albus]|uniref:hypothetical protein n=1 Tax=Ferruginibacter albus TaxID=2875540 RepID=UPI001CC56B13|nr:hypothetical protein [Ferruginibacter albus]UAY50941.1 hypothetical protein K9M53_10105 [Ferruginibacter albus]